MQVRVATMMVCVLLPYVLLDVGALKRKEKVVN
jgi:hypothetical protein